MAPPTVITLLDVMGPAIFEQPVTFRILLAVRHAFTTDTRPGDLLGALNNKRESFAPSEFVK